MLSRFAGVAGRPRLVDAIRAQQLVLGADALAAALADVVSVRVAQTGETFISQGAADSDLYLILMGSAVVRINGHEIARRTAGQHVGEMALIDSTAKRSADVVALEDSVLAVLPEPAFRRIAEDYPQIWRPLALELASRLRQRARLVRIPNSKPILFIGSSRESLSIGEALRDALQGDKLEVRLWTEGVFRASSSALESLVEQAQAIDFAALIVVPEDAITSRGRVELGPRDNVVLELGLFMGALGRDRTVIVRERGAPVKSPSDLLGITPLEFESPTTGALPSRLASTISEIRALVARLGAK